MKWLWAVPVLLLGCSRTSENKSAPVAADAGAPDAAGTAIVADAAPLPAFGDGAHDYRGTLGNATSVSMHLVRSGTTVTGAYLYTQMGKPIGLRGTMDETIALDEFVNDTVTGHLTLHLEGRKLVGTWSDAAKKRTIPLTLEPSAPVPALLAPSPTLDVAQRAEHCLEDVGCSAADAERLFLDADAKGADVDCTRFLDGLGVKKDLVRARACFERTLGHATCDGGSPFMAQGELITLRTDGTGGPKNLAGGRALLAGCFMDVTTKALLDRLDKVAADPSTPPIDFCKAIDQTTLVAGDCESRALRREHDHASLVAKKIYEDLDEPGRARLRAEISAFAAYLDADGEVTLAAVEGGSMRVIFLLDRKRALEAVRAKRLDEWGTFAAPAVSAADLARAKSDDEKAVRDAASVFDADTDAQHAARSKKAGVAAQKAWLRYRDAEVALYTQAFGKARGDALTVALTAERTTALTADDEH